MNRGSVHRLARGNGAADGLPVECEGYNYQLMMRVVFLIVSLIAAPVAAQDSAPPAAKDSQQPQFNENVENLFDGQYPTFGVLGDASLIDDDFEQARFYSPGAPRAAWIGAEVRF
jgi:hypothetical protein